jgi:hypothetical protein
LAGTLIDPGNDVTVSLNLSDDSVVHIAFDRCMIGALVVKLWAALTQILPDVEEATAITQPLTLLSARPFVLSDGRTGLELDLEGMRVPVVFPLGSIESIRNELGRLADLSRSSTQGPLN